MSILPYVTNESGVATIHLGMVGLLAIVVACAVPTVYIYVKWRRSQWWRGMEKSWNSGTRRFVKARYTTK